jgi:propanol-preferring alcohol dehydrogenase
MAHIVAPVARWRRRKVFAFTRPGDAKTQASARNLGAAWASGSDEAPPEQLDAVILFAPVGGRVPLTPKAMRKGGRMV